MKKQVKEVPPYQVLAANYVPEMAQVARSNTHSATQHVSQPSEVQIERRQGHSDALESDARRSTDTRSNKSLKMHQFASCSSPM